MDKEQKRKARQVREDYLRSRSPRDEMQPADIVDVIAGDPDGLLPVAVLANDLKIRIPLWEPAPPVPNAEEWLILEWRLKTQTEYSELSKEIFSPLPITEPFPLDRVIKRQHFNGLEGTFDFRYGVKLWSGPRIDYSLPQPITIDRTPIYGQTDPPAVVDPGPVTDAVLNADGGVWLEVPDFVEDKKDAVRIAVVWAFSPPPAEQPIVPDFIVDLPANRRVKVDRGIIERLPSGDHYVAYELYDKAGNRSRPSRLRAVKVALGPLPEQLKAPFVPLAPGLGAGDDLIDLEDAHVGVVVEVPAYGNPHHADQIVVKWGDAELPGVPVGVGANPFPVESPVNWTNLKAQYTSAPNTQSTPVSYRIVRGTTDFPLAPADAITVNVNLAYTGPENPNEPDPVNPTLDLVLVRGDSNTDNHLIDTDNGKPATATIVVYDPPTKDDVITLYWNGVAVADTVTLDAEKADDQVTINVTWDEINAGNGGSVPVHYTLSHPRFENEQRSRTTDVLVDAIPVIMDPPTYPDISDANPDPIDELWVLNCDSLRKRKGTSEIGYQVHIPGSSYLVAGEPIELRWVLRKADTTTEVVGSELKASLTLPADAETNGLDWFITPYDPHILLAHAEPGHWAWAELTYSVKVGGKPVTSQIKHEVVGIHDLSVGGSCDITAVPELS